MWESLQTQAIADVSHKGGMREGQQTSVPILPQENKTNEKSKGAYSNQAQRHD